jgi:hypothetical protein
VGACASATQETSLAHSASIARDATRAASVVSIECFLLLLLPSSPEDKDKASNQGEKPNHTTGHSSGDRAHIRSVVIGLGRNWGRR